MNIKNYTSEVAPEKSVAHIEKTLVEIGAKNINKEYVHGMLSGIKFLVDIKTPNGINMVAFELPVQVNEIFNFYWNGRYQKTEKQKKMVMEQSLRTAWKIISDWVDIQASMIHLKQAEILQVFLPYALAEGGETIFSKLKSGNFKALQSGQ